MALNRMTKAERTRCCEHCGKSFVARRAQIEAGRGKFCSHRCAYDGGAHAVLTDSATKQRAIENRKASVAVNGTKHKSGAEHHSWKGGKDAYIERHREADRAWTKQYRKNNPVKVREFRRRRRGRVIGKLPPGTLQRIGDAQRWRCACCAKDIRRAFTMDHITALANGGKHEPLNLQLLCRSCNAKKWIKHPVDFMQERGFLL